MTVTDQAPVPGDRLGQQRRAALRSALEDEQLFAALSTAISARAVEKFEDRHNRNRNFYITIGTLALALVGTGLGFIANEVLSARVGEKVEVRLAEQLSDFTFATELSALSFEVAQIDRSDGIDRQTARRVVEDIIGLYQGYAATPDPAKGLTVGEVIDNRRLLRFPVETMARNLLAANLDREVLRLAEVAPILIENSDQVTQALIQTYGRDLLAAPGAPDAWTEPDGALRDTFKRYQTYAQRARQTGFPELYLMFELLLRHLEGRDHAELVALAQRVDDLSPQDNQFFRQVMASLATEGFKAEPDSETLLVATRVRRFLEGYAASSETLRRIVDDLPPLRDG